MDLPNKQKLLDEYKRGFYWTTKAWYGENKDYRRIGFGLFGKEGNSTIGEMSMKWHDLKYGLKDKSVPRLDVFNDAWFALSTFQDLLEVLAEVDEEDITEERFVDILLDCGFEDLTEYEFPYE